MKKQTKSLLPRLAPLALAMAITLATNHQQIIAAPTTSRPVQQQASQTATQATPQENNFTLTNQTAQPIYFQVFGKKTGSDQYSLLSSQEPILVHPKQTGSLSLADSDDYDLIDIYSAPTTWKLQGTEKKLAEALGVPPTHTKTTILRNIRRQTFFIHANQEKIQNRSATLLRPAPKKGTGNQAKIAERLKNNFVDYSSFERTGSVTIAD